MSGKQKSLLIVIFLLPVLIFNIIEYFSVPKIEEEADKVTIEIKRGATLSEVADSLAFYNLIKSKDIFIYWARALDYDTKVKAGLFEIPRNLNYVQTLQYLSESKPKQIFVTLIEGWSNEAIAGQLAENLGIDSSQFVQKCKSVNFINQLGIQEKSLLGYLLPDTYAFYWGMQTEAIIRFLVAQTSEIFESDSVKSALRNHKMSIHEVLTMASIIEGEAIFDNERKTIASVYYNRIKRGMRLQADPTIQFIIDGPPRRVLYKDLEIDSPYNTYKYSGLPPGPINNPGRASIMAAIFPDSSEYLYFVARGDGSHAFSRNAREHARAKAEFDKVRRRVRLEQKKARKQN